MTFKERLKESGITHEELAKAAKVKPSTIEVYANTNKPSHKTVAAFEKLLASRSHSSNNAHEEEAEKVGRLGEDDTAPPRLVGTIVKVPINPFLRMVQLESGEKVRAWCKKDLYQRKGVKVELELQSDRHYYIKRK